MSFSIIVAATQHGGIGMENKLPWSIPEDLRFFRTVTMDSCVIMGRRTWQSICGYLKHENGLPKRTNVVVSRAKEQSYGKHQFSCFHDALQFAHTTQQQIIVIGGAALYAEALEHHECSKIYLTTIFNDIKCDAHIPTIDVKKYQFVRGSEIKQHGDIRFQFVEYDRRHEEYQYIDLVRSVIYQGESHGNRTAVDAFSKFGAMMRYNLRNGKLPLLTTKDVFWRGVVEELLWIISGDTNNETLVRKRVKIWCGNASSEYLKTRGLDHYKDGELGPIYGFQWRHFGAKYVDCNTDYSKQGVDQLQRVIDILQKDPTDRRLLVSAWNPVDLEKMALPPCHVLYQFYVNQYHELSCLMYQRSADLGLGVPFNIASYSLLTHMVAHVCGLKPGEFVHVLGNAHVYENHVEPLQLQIKREPRDFPTLKLNSQKTKIDDFELEDFTLENYNPHPKIPMEMAV